jgi:antitoxin component of RelBE/YafQ-DinJ toxin-antitoxin module
MLSDTARNGLIATSSAAGVVLVATMIALTLTRDSSVISPHGSALIADPILQSSSNTQELYQTISVKQLDQKVRQYTNKMNAIYPPIKAHLSTDAQLNNDVRVLIHLLQTRLKSGKLEVNVDVVRKMVEAYGLAEHMAAHGLTPQAMLRHLVSGRRMRESSKLEGGAAHLLRYLHKDDKRLHSIFGDLKSSLSIADGQKLIGEGLHEADKEAAEAAKHAIANQAGVQAAMEAARQAALQAASGVPGAQHVSQALKDAMAAAAEVDQANKVAAMVEAMRKRAAELEAKGMHKEAAAVRAAMMKIQSAHDRSIHDAEKAERDAKKLLLAPPGKARGYFLKGEHYERDARRQFRTLNGGLFMRNIRHEVHKMTADDERAARIEAMGILKVKKRLLDLIQAGKLTDEALQACGLRRGQLSGNIASAANAANAATAAHGVRHQISASKTASTDLAKLTIDNLKVQACLLAKADSESIKGALGNLDAVKALLAKEAAGDAMAAKLLNALNSGDLSQLSQAELSALMKMSKLQAQAEKAAGHNFKTNEERLNAIARHMAGGLKKVLADSAKEEGAALQASSAINKLVGRAKGVLSSEEAAAAAASTYGNVNAASENAAEADKARRNLARMRGVYGRMQSSVQGAENAVSAANGLGRVIGGVLGSSSGLAAQMSAANRAAARAAELARKAGHDPNAMYEIARKAAAMAGFTGPNAVAEWAKLHGHSVGGVLGKWAQAFAGMDTSSSGGRDAASAVAHKLGLDPTKMRRDAAAAAKAAGFCHGACTDEEIKKWAIANAANLPGHLGQYARAFAGMDENVMGGKHAADAVARALGLDPKKAYNMAMEAARKAGFCHHTCTAADVQKWAQTVGKNAPPPLGKYAAAFASGGSPSGGRGTADAVALALGVDPKQMFSQAAAAARAAGYCKSQCTEAEMKLWAQNEGRNLPPPLGAYAQAFGGAPSKEQHAADAMAKALGMDPNVLFKQAADKAKAAGYCLGKTCTPEEIKRWAAEHGSSLSGPLGAYAKAFAGHVSHGGKSAADAVAAALGLNPTQAYEQAVNMAQAAGYCAAVCSEDDIRRWAKDHGGKLKGPFAKYVQAFGSGASGREAADDIAIALGQDPKVMMSQASSAAKAAGYCQSVCTDAEIKRWAMENGKDLPGPLGAYARAFAGIQGTHATGGKAAADAVARALGEDPEKLHAKALAAARAAGFTGPNALQNWARSVGKDLPPPLGAYAKAYAGHGKAPHAGRLDFAAAVAKQLGQDPDKLYTQALAAAHAAGFSGPNAVLQWAKTQGKNLPPPLGIYAKAYASNTGGSVGRLEEWARKFARETSGASVVAGMGGQSAADAVARALGVDPSEMFKRAQDAARQGGFCKTSHCTDAEIKRWAEANGGHLPDPLGAYAKAYAGGSAEGGRSSADAIAHALGKDPKKLFAEAAAMAQKAGYCKGVCTEEEIKKWAHEQGANLPGYMGAYAKAFAGTMKGGQSAADALARSMGLDPKKMYKDAMDAAMAAGYCSKSGCSEAQIRAWAHDNASTLSGPLGAYAKAFAGKPAGGKHTADALARSLGQDPAVMYQQVVDAAKKAGFCKAECTDQEIRAWAAKHGSSLPGALGAYAKAYAGMTASSGAGAAAAVARALGVDPKKMQDELASAARKAGYCRRVCTQAELVRFAQEKGHTLTGHLAKYAHAYGGGGHHHAGQAAADAVARALGVDPQVMFQKMQSAARAAGFCKQTCSKADLARWAASQGSNLSGPLGAYARAFVGKRGGTGGLAAAQAMAAALGMDPKVMYKQAADAAKAAGYCKSTCTASEIRRWAVENAGSLPGHLGAYAKAFAGISKPGGISAANAVAKALGVDPAVMLQKAMSAAKAAGFCSDVCTNEELKNWAKAQGGALPPPLGAWAKALASDPNPEKAKVDTCRVNIQVPAGQVFAGLGPQLTPPGCGPAGAGTAPQPPCGCNTAVAQPTPCSCAAPQPAAPVITQPAAQCTPAQPVGCQPQPVQCGNPSGCAGQQAAGQLAANGQPAFMQQMAQVGKPLGNYYHKGIEVMHIGKSLNAQQQPAATTQMCPESLRGAICQPQPLAAPPPYEPENPLADVHIEMNPEGAPGGARMTGVEDPGSTNEVKLYDANENLPPGAHMPGEMPVHMNVQHSMRGLPNIPGSQQVWVNPGNPGGKPNIMTDYQGGIQQTIGIPGTDGNPGVQIHGISPFSNIVHVNSLADVPQKALVGGVHAVTMPVANTEPEKMQSTQGTAPGAGVGMPEMPNAQIGGVQIKQETEDGGR